jgi:pilus assembly protein CpaD
MNRKLPISAALLTLAFAAAACSTAGGKGPQPITPTERYSMKVETHPEQMAFAPHADGLSDHQRAALDTYVQGWVADGGGMIEVSTPRGGGEASARTAWAVKARLTQLGVGDDDVKVVAYEPGQAGAPVLIVYQRYAAVIPECNKSWTNLAANGANASQKNFGCATTANMAAQIENPRDIVAPHGADPADAARRQVVMEHYRKGEPTQTKSDATGGKVAAVQD